LGEASEPHSRDEVARAGTIGRRVALGLYLSVLVYITAVAFASVVPQVFWPEPSPAAVAAAPADCGEALRTLEQALLERSSRVLSTASPANPEDGIEAFFHTWDDDYLALAARCRGETYHSLGRLRYQLEITLRRYEREDARLAREVAAGIDASR